MIYAPHSVVLTSDAMECLSVTDKPTQIVLPGRTTSEASCIFPTKDSRAWLPESTLLSLVASVHFASANLSGGT